MALLNTVGLALTGMFLLSLLVLVVMVFVDMTVEQVIDTARKVREFNEWMRGE